MHLLEKYSLNCGINPLKLDPPKIFECYFPTPEKYIVIHPFSGMPSKNYSFFQDLVDFIRPHLEKNNYKILQIGTAKDPAIFGANHCQGKTTINQAFYIIKNCDLLISNDSFSVHAASAYQKPLIALYGATLAESCGPFWKNENQSIIQATTKTKKPVFSNQDPNQSIDSIKLEQIIQEISKKTNIELPSIKTFFIGKSYLINSAELIPSKEEEIDEEIKKINLSNIYIRLDRENAEILSKEESLDASRMLLHKEATIVTENLFLLEKIPLPILKSKISLVVYKINRKNFASLENDLKLIQKIKDLQIPIGCHLEKEDFSEEELSDIKMLLFDVCAIRIDEGKQKEIKRFKKAISEAIESGEEVFIQTSNLIFSGKSKYVTVASFLEKKASLSKRISLNDIKNIDNLSIDVDNFFVFTQKTETKNDTQHAKK